MCAKFAFSNLFYFLVGEFEKFFEEDEFLPFGRFGTGGIVGAEVVALTFQQNFQRLQLTQRIALERFISILKLKFIK